MTKLRIPPAGLVGLALGAQYAIAGKRLGTKTSATIATAINAGSAWLIVGSLLHFRRRGTTVNPVDVGAVSLVTEGPNRLTRNPMYVGMAGILVAHAVFRRSFTLLIPAAAFALAIDRLQIPEEEAMLKEQFETEFDDYVARTPRWLVLGKAP